MTSPDYPGTRLTDRKELLRRVAPLGKSKGVGDSGTPAAAAFKPEPKGDPGGDAFMPGGRGSHDNGGLSTKRAAETPEDAYWAYLRSAREPGGRLARGTWGFTVGEADDLELPGFDDGGIDDAHPVNHATVWFPMPPEPFRQKLKLLHERLADDLPSHALKHGCLYRPDDPVADAKSLENASV